MSETNLYPVSFIQILNSQLRLIMNLEHIINQCEFEVVGWKTYFDIIIVKTRFNLSIQTLLKAMLCNKQNTNHSNLPTHRQIYKIQIVNNYTLFTIHYPTSSHRLYAFDCLV